jgi:two-component system, NarL family, nitrate/nitrite response regulator NarL
MKVRASRNAHGRAGCQGKGVATRCLIVDDSARFVEAARAVLERGGIAVVGVASTVTDALQRADELRPDVMLLDIDLGGESGFEIVRRLTERARSTLPRHPRIILISTHAQEDFEELIEMTSVIGFLAKSALSASAVHELLYDAD